MAKNKWLYNDRGWTETATDMVGKVVLSPFQAQGLGYDINKPNLTSVLFGDFTKWCSSFTYYPLNICSKSLDGYKLSGGGVDYDLDVLGYMQDETYYGYTMGEYYYPAATSYLDFEPYTKAEVYLPYYGFVSLKIADVQGKYVQFRLYVDFNTGQAQYIIGVNDVSVQMPNYPSVEGAYDDNTRILYEYSFQLGVQIPLSTTGLNDAIRNTALSVMKGVADTVGSFATDMIPTSRVVNTVKTVKTARNAQTGRQITKATSTQTSESERYDYSGGDRINTAIDTAYSVLANLSLSPQTVTSGNGTLNLSASQEIVIVKTKAMTVVNPTTNIYYKRLMGAPSGMVRSFGECKGYTKVSDMVFENSGFDFATSAELAELEQIVYQGVILDDTGAYGYITFRNDDNEEFTLFGSKTWDGVVEYSTDTTCWNEWNGEAITSANGKLYLRGYDNTTFYNGDGVRFKLSNAAGCYGNIQTLLQCDAPPEYVSDHCYYNMFYANGKLTHTPELPATTLAPYCYSYMFSGCSSLTDLPELPATTLPEYCYVGMFSQCSNIRLSAAQTDVYNIEYRIPTADTGTLLATNALNNMFSNTGGTFRSTPTVNTTYYIHDGTTINFTVDGETYSVISGDTWAKWIGQNRPAGFTIGDYGSYSNAVLKDGKPIALESSSGTPIVGSNAVQENGVYVWYVKRWSITYNITATDTEVRAANGTSVPPAYIQEDGTAQFMVIGDTSVSYDIAVQYATADETTVTPTDIVTLSNAYDDVVVTISVSRANYISLQ